MAPSEQKESCGPSSWKSRLSEQQLKRKRLTDREHQRENRNSARRTIAKLKEQLQLVTSGKSQILTAELLEANTKLVCQRDRYKSRIDAVCLALGIPNTDDAAAENQESQSPLRWDASNRETREPSLETASGQLQEAHQNQNMERGRDQIDQMMNSRMILSQKSPFVRICANIQDNVRPGRFSDEEFLDALAQWKRSLPTNSSVSDLASQLYQIHLPPTMTVESTIQARIRSPTFFDEVLRELSPANPAGGGVKPDRAQVLPTPNETQPREVDSADLMNREIIFCSLEATRFWNYHSDIERLAMFWAVYTITTVFCPTAQNLAKCPAWYRPIASQCSHPHPSFVDFIPWPLIRDRLVHTYEHYQKSDLVSRVFGNLKMVKPWKDCKRPLIKLNSTATSLVLDTEFEASLQDLSTLGMKDDFFTGFPELGIYVYRSKDQDGATRMNSLGETVRSVEEEVLQVTWDQSSMCMVPLDASVSQQVDTVHIRADSDSTHDGSQYDLYADMNHCFPNPFDNGPGGYLSESFQNTSTNGYFVV